MRKIALLLLLLAFSTGIGKGLYFLKGGFTARRIHTLSTPASDHFDEETKMALRKPFRYLGRGRQCFAFASEDGKYVLKFPRTDIYTTPFWVRALPVTAYREKLEKDHFKREQFILESFHIASKDLKDQTGILALHLGESASKEKLTVIDAMGCKHHLTLGKTPFVLQSRHPLLTRSFLTALQQGDKHEAERILSSLINTIAQRAAKGILNRDRSFLRNYGFDGEKAYQIDVGSFFKDEEMTSDAIYRKSLLDSIDPIQQWLAKTDPEMLHILNTKLLPQASIR